MCRWAAYVGASLPLNRLVFEGPHGLHRQSWEPRELRSGSVNADGWGVAWYTAERPPADARPVRMARTEPIWYDPDVPNLLASLRAGLALAALRNATPGLPVGRTGLLPHVHGRWAFVLNGYVPDFRVRHMRALRTDLPDPLYGALQGSSDAETLFLRALMHIEAGASPRDSLTRVVTEVAARLPEGEAAPLTMALAGPSGLWVHHTVIGDGSCNSLYVADRPALAPDGVLIASEPFDDDPAWTRVADHERLEVPADGAGARVSR